MNRCLICCFLTVALLCCMTIPTYAAEVGGSTVDLFYWDPDRTVKTAFAGTSAFLDIPYEPFQGQIKVVLPEEIAAGDDFDLDVSFTGSEGIYTFTSLSITTTDGLYFEVFDYSYVEMDSNHISIYGLGVDEKFIFSIGVVYINFSVTNASYEESTTVINGTPTKRYGYYMSVSNVNVSGVGELGFLAGILQGILDLPNHIIQGIKQLFVPSQADVLEFRDKVEALLSSRLGAAYEATDIVENFAYSLGSGALSSSIADREDPETIILPELTVNLAGTDFTFGGWEVRIIPEGFESIVESLKLIVNIVCTLMVVNVLRTRLGAFFR